MPEATPAQLTALARIKFLGLDVWTGDPFDEGAMATLDAPAPSYELINIATVRKLVRQGWIGNLAAEDDESRRATIWILTPAGLGLLNRHKEYFEPANREADHVQMLAVLREASIRQRPQRHAAQHDWATGVEWTRDGLKQAGFRGFIPFHALPDAQVPRGAGVYAVLRPSHIRPTFRELSVAGHLKTKSPSVSITMLESNWIPGVEVLYIGKAEWNEGSRRGLKKRLDEYRRHGQGEPIGHWGGRYIWQLEDCYDLIVAWKEASTNGAEEVESALLSSFIEKFGALPFANLKRGRNVAAGM